MVSIVALSFHPAFTPPRSGGEHRLFYIYKNLSVKYKISLISFTYPNESNAVEIISHNENFKEFRIPKTRFSIFLHHFINKFTSIKECSAIVTSIESRFNNNFKIITKDLLRDADLVSFVYPYLYTLDNKLLINKKIIYESHNVEHELMKQSIGGSFIGSALLNYVYWIERSLSNDSDLIFTTSKEDKSTLCSKYSLDNKKIFISPNGFNMDEYINLSESSGTPLSYVRKCVFVGSYHPPNIEAVDHIISIARQMPDIYFFIAGNATQYYAQDSENLVETTEFNSELDLLDSEPLSLSGFYDVELWDSVPTIWSKPEFSLTVREPIESLVLRLYSPFMQKLHIKSEFGTDYFYAVEEGFNELHLNFEAIVTGVINFSCEKIHRDQIRRLGIALQELNYRKDSEELYYDLLNKQQITFGISSVRNVIMFGQISDEQKRKLYISSDLALNPMQSGSGTNIKMLDYMAAGLPVISTPIGARGLEIENNTHAVICELEDFPSKIREVLDDDLLKDKLISKGRKLVMEKYDWKNITDDMCSILDTVLI